jgi:hypothetical protein
MAHDIQNLNRYVLYFTVIPRQVNPYNCKKHKLTTRVLLQTVNIHNRHENCVTSATLTSISKITVFCDMTQCNLIDRYQCFGGTYYLNFRDRSQSSTLKMKAVSRLLRNCDTSLSNYTASHTRKQQSWTLTLIKKTVPALISAVQAKHNFWTRWETFVTCYINATCSHTHDMTVQTPH